MVQSWNDWQLGVINCHWVKMMMISCLYVLTSGKISSATLKRVIRFKHIYIEEVTVWFRIFQIKYVNSKLTNDSLATVNYNTYIFNLMYESAEISLSETFISPKSIGEILYIYRVLYNCCMQFVMDWKFDAIQASVTHFNRFSRINKKSLHFGFLCDKNREANLFSGFPTLHISFLELYILRYE